MMAACSDNDGAEDMQNPKPVPPTPVVSLLTAEEQAALPATNKAQLDFLRLYSRLQNRAKTCSARL